MTWWQWLLLSYVAACLLLTYSGRFTVVYVAPVAWLLSQIGMQAITLGRFCCTVRKGMILSDAGWKHEHWHWRRQWCVLGPLMPPVYLALLAWKGYDKHPFENAARRAAGQPER